MSAPYADLVIPDPIVPPKTVLYEEDSYGWAIQQAELLRAGQRDAIDLPHLAQVLAGLAAQDRAKLKAGLEQVMQALLKWDHAPDTRSRAWSLTIHQQRRRILRQIRRQPGLMSAEAEVTQGAYAVARQAAAKDLGFDDDTLPVACPYDWADMMERDIAWLGG